MPALAPAVIANALSPCLYHYSRSGELAEIHSNLGVSRFAHDAHGRLIAAHTPQAGLQRWTFDLASAVQGAPVRFFPDAAPTLEELARKISEDQALACYNDSLNLRRVAAHPLNARLLLEDTLIRYCRHFHNGK